MQKVIRSLFLSVLFITFSSINVFSQRSGGVFALVTSSDFALSYSAENDNVGNNSSGFIQAGYLFNFKNGFGASLLGDLGYNMSVTFRENETSTGNMIYGTYIHSIKLGVTSVFHMRNFGFGFGVGVKIPVSGFTYIQNNDESAGVFNITARELESDINVTPYIRLSFDYFLFVDTRTSVNIGFNTGYDFEIKGRDFHASPEGFFLGLHLGIRLAPRV